MPNGVGIVSNVIAKDTRVQFDIEEHKGREIAVNIKLIKVAGNANGRINASGRPAQRKA